MEFNDIPASSSSHAGGSASQAQEHLTARDYVHILRRRKWTAIGAVAAVLVAALAWSLTQTAVYEASADVLLSRQNLATSLTQVSDPSTLASDRERIVETQAQ